MILVISKKEVVNNVLITKELSRYENECIEWCKTCLISCLFDVIKGEKAVEITSDSLIFYERVGKIVYIELFEGIVDKNILDILKINNIKDTFEGVFDE